MASYINQNFEKFPSTQMPDDIKYVSMHEDAYKFMLSVIEDCVKKEKLVDTILHLKAQLAELSASPKMSDYIELLEKELKMTKFSRFITTEISLETETDYREWHIDPGKRKEARHA